MIRSSLSRRRFVHGLATVAGAAFAGPYLLRAAEPGKDKIRFAHVGTGGQAAAHHELSKGDGMCVCYADADKLRYGAMEKIAPKARAYTDYRKMFDAHLKEIDAVIVAVPDHHHFLPSMIAVTNGKHCYTEKPLCWSVMECRKLAEATAAKKVATQMGNMGHAKEGNRLIVEWVRAGLLGEIKEVHTWTDRPFWPQGIERGPTRTVPASLDWESWIGPAAFRGYHENLHPFNWRGWFDFGCGDIGDMACHTWENVFWSMDPDYPETVELVRIEGQAGEMYPKKSIIKWVFPAKGKRAGFIATWSSGRLKPEVPEEMLNDPTYTDGGKKKAELPGSGNLYIGTKGKLLVSGDYGDSPRLIPESFHRETRKPEKTIPRSPGHKQEWLMAIRGEKSWDYPGSNFATYAGMLTEVQLLGAIAVRIGQLGMKIECDPVARTVKTREAQALLWREPRRGWGI